MKILIIGDSHTGALNRGLKSLKNAGALAQDDAIVIRPLGGGHILPTPFFEDAGDHIRIVDPLYMRHINRIPPVPAGADVIGLSMPLWPMRVVHSFVWGKLSLARKMPGRTPVSQAVFRQMVLADQRYILRFAETLQRLGFVGLTISAPGLFRDHNVLQHIDPKAALEIFNGHRAIVKDELAKRSLPFIDIPDECLDPEGYMLPEFRHEDPDDDHHANADFGALMIRQVEAWLESASRNNQPTQRPDPGKPAQQI